MTPENKKSPLIEHIPATDMRIQEEIYGHRFGAHQEPFMIVLETLAIYSSMLSYPTQEDSQQSRSYSLHQRRKMRFLLFHDPHLEHVIKDNHIADSQKWRVWKNRINQQFLATSHNHTRDDEKDAFAYLDEKFSSDISALHQAIRILRSYELDRSHNRSKSHRFLAVQGPHTIYADDDGRQTKQGREYFRRGGEIVYLMLHQSSSKEKLNEKIHQRFFNQNTPINKIAEALSEDDSADAKSVREIGFLPDRSLPFEAYDRMAEDWIHLLNCDTLPDDYLFEPLFRITGLNLVAYFAEAAQETIAKYDKPPALPIVVDLTEGRNKHLRQAAENSLFQHRVAAHKAIDAFVHYKLNTEPYRQDWQNAQKQNDISKAKHILKEAFSLKKDFSTDKDTSIESLLHNVIKNAQKRDDNNIYQYLLPLTKGIGLATAYKNKQSFILNNEMLFTLILTNVQRTIPLKEFIKTLYDRYRIVIGPHEAREAFGRRIRSECYEENLETLEKRLTRLSLAQRLSDDCAFVSNPYATANKPSTAKP